MELLRVWLPFIILVGLWVLFLQVMRKRQKRAAEMLQENNALLTRIAESNDRILAALEARSK